MKFMKKFIKKIDKTTALCCVIAILSVLMAFNVGRDEICKKRIAGLTGQLERTQTALREANADKQMYKNILANQKLEELNIVTDKVQRGESYTLVINNDYYEATKEQFDSAEIGMSFDVSVLQKGE